MSQGTGIGNLLIFALPILLIVYMVSTQRRRQRAVQERQRALQVGDEVSTTSGLLGRITVLEPTVVTLEVSPGVHVRFDRRAIAGPAPQAPVAPDASVAPDSSVLPEPVEDTGPSSSPSEGGPVEPPASPPRGATDD